MNDANKVPNEFGIIYAQPNPNCKHIMHVKNTPLIREYKHSLEVNIEQQQNVRM